MVGSGNSAMSDSLIAWKPRIEEPSKREAVVEDRLVERRHRDGEVLLDAGQVDEADVDHLDALVLDVLEQLVAVAEHSSSLAARQAWPPMHADQRVSRCDAAPDVARDVRVVSRPYPVCFSRCNRCPPTPAPALSDPAAPSVETASWGRRILALVVDWFACTLVVIAVRSASSDYDRDRHASGFYVLGVFVLESAVFTALVGRLVRQARDPAARRPHRRRRPARPAAAALARPVLIALVIPPLVFRPDRRGLHDLMAGSAVVRLSDVPSPRWVRR